jgi:hypothetical protein
MPSEVDHAVLDSVEEVGCLEGRRIDGAEDVQEVARVRGVAVLLALIRH